MKKILAINPKIIYFIFLILPFHELYGQSAAKFDEIVSNIYNLDFKEVPEKIEELRKISPQIANYLQIDYHWWKMISFQSEQNESEFVAVLNELNNPDKNNRYQNFDRLIFFTYQIRYENLLKKNFSKYLTLLKFHFFMENIDSKNIKNSDSFMISIFNLMDETNTFMKYKFLNDHGFKTKNNMEKCRLSLQKIESMSNPEFKSFDAVKTYLLAKIYLEIENDGQKALTKFAKLSDLFPQNTIFRQSINDCKKMPAL